MTLITDAWQALGGRGMAPPESYEAVCEEAKRWSYNEADTRTMEQMITDVLKQYLTPPINALNAERWKQQFDKTTRIPDGFTEYEDSVMSNFDHAIDREVVSLIQGAPLYAQYAGWDFCGWVWWQGDKWCCEVWTYGVYQKTFMADTLEEIQSDVCDEYGSH